MLEIEAAARTISDGRDRDTALTALALAALRVGEPFRAEAAARDLGDAELAACVLICTARAASRAGDEPNEQRLLDLAEATVLTIPGAWRPSSPGVGYAPGKRLEALVRSARLIGDTPRGRWLLAEAVRTSAWIPALQALPQVAPEAVAALADKYERPMSAGRPRLL